MACANFPVARGYPKRIFSRQACLERSRKDAKNAKFRVHFFLCGPFDVAQDMLCAFARNIPMFGCGSGALRPLRCIRWLKSSPVMVLYGKGELLAAIVLMSFGSFVIYEARGLPYHSSVRGLM